MTFNEKIDKFMNENNISNLKQFAKQANIPYTTLRDFYEKKSADNSRLSTIRKLSMYMQCSMDYLAYDNIHNKNEILLNGLDINNDKSYSDKEFVTKLNIDMKKSQENELFNYLNNNNFDYKILDKKEISPKNELDVLFDKHKDILTDSDKTIIKTIIEQRKKEIDKELDGE